LPCNVILIEQEQDKIEVAVMDAYNSMKMIGNPELESIATQVTDKLLETLEKLNNN